MINYREYLNSDYWKQVSLRLRKHYKKCHGCGSTKNLNVHHMSYKRLGREKNKNLRVVCYDCHSDIHFILNEQRKRRGYKVNDLKKVTLRFLKRKRKETGLILP